MALGGNSNWGTFGRYGEFEVVGFDVAKPKLLGAGSFGKTFEAFRADTAAGGVTTKHFALKVLNPNLLTSELKRKQLRQELESLSEFDHPNLIRYIRSGEQENEVYYAMDLCRGGDLAQLVRRFGPLPERIAALIGLQVAKGLRAVHERYKLVHRDIKPSNIMLAEEINQAWKLEHFAMQLEEQDNLCRIVDFGLVSFRDESHDAPQRFVGSPMYASPEQIREQPIDGRSDIYSLGMTLWYLCQGKGPLLGPGGSDLTTGEAIGRHTQEAEHINDFPPNLSAAFRNLLASMVSKRPEARFVTAAELQNALRQYLSSQTDTVSFPLTRQPAPLEATFELGQALRTNAAGSTYAAKHRRSGESVRLTLAAEAGALDPGEIEALALGLCEAARLTLEPSRPKTLLPVREVILASDILCYTEPLEPHISLADFLRGRMQARRAVTFVEGVSVFGPIAIALDYLLKHGRDAVNLTCDDIILTGSGLGVGGTGSLTFMPLNERTDLQVYFSMICPAKKEVQEMDVDPMMSGSMDSIYDPDQLHPVPALARLIYRVLNGSDVPSSIKYSKHVYAPATTLENTSNNLIRDLLCKERPWTGAVAVLQELCRYEEVRWRPGKGEFGQVGSSGASTLSHHSAARDSMGAGGSVGAGGSTGGWGGGRRPEGSTLGEPEDVCEVIRPGVVHSPYDPDGVEQAVPSRLWAPSGRVQCQNTHRYFRLPRKIDPLEAEVLQPGLIHSPYAPVGATQEVPWDRWLPGEPIVCLETGKKIVLPQDIAPPEAILIPDAPGFVLSPYDRKTRVAVDPSQWMPGALVQTADGRPFVLPADLPVTEALADEEKPGELRSPYAPTAVWKIEPAEWVAGVMVECPVSHRQLRTPETVERWPAPAELVDASQRLVSDPWNAGGRIVIPPASWHSGGVVTTEGGRRLKLPANLPLLTGELVAGQPGKIRSPYSGEVVAVEFERWVAGGQVLCPVAKTPFLLPGNLPELMPEGRLCPGRTGWIKSPFPPYAEFEIKPMTEWQPGAIVTSPGTNRTFRLPADLPLYRGTVEKEKPLSVQSPFSGQWQQVGLDDWVPNRPIECQVTHKLFALPAALSEYLFDGEWVPGSPGHIKSPFEPYREVEITAQQWVSGGSVVCPATNRRFRIPGESNFPSLELEKDALRYAWANPEQGEDEAARALRAAQPPPLGAAAGAVLGNPIAHAAHPQATGAQIAAIWRRHELGTAPERLAAETLGEIPPGEPGTVISPYGQRRKCTVPPALWVAGAFCLCPETGRRIRLPSPLPMLLARPVADRPGRLVSPYAPDRPAFGISPDAWARNGQIQCPYTKQPLRLPPNLPDWIPQGRISAGQPGLIFSPHGSERLQPVLPADWEQGKRMTCAETGYWFVLPSGLPPLIGAVIAGRPGIVVSPYNGAEVALASPQQWAPRAPVTCQTGRIFLLPDQLEPWIIPKKKSNAPLILAAAAGLVVLVLVALHPWKKEDVISTPTPAPATPTPTPTPPPTPEPRPTPTIAPALPPTMGKVVVKNWNDIPRPTEVKVLYHGSPLTAEILSAGPGAFKLNISFPGEARKDPSPSIQLTVPGWIPATVRLRVLANGTLTGVDEIELKQAP